MATSVSENAVGWHAWEYQLPLLARKRTWVMMLELKPEQKGCKGNGD
jgi:hypothetical protein